MLDAARWSPYLAGGLMGVLSWLTFLFSDQRIGVSTAYVQTAGMIERAAGAKVEDNPYYAKNMPFLDWGWLFVVGIVLGALISALASGDFAWKAVPGLWAQAVSPSVLVRWVTAFAGGVLAGFGARLAGGCTSGHGISGTMQMTAASWLAVGCFFAGGMLSIRLVY